jgi:hypothetical protein
MIPDKGGAGYFNGLIANEAVSGPIVTTQSIHDTAVGLAYPAAVGLVGEVAFGQTLPKFGGIGTWGIQGTEIAEKRPMLDATAEYEFQPGHVYNLYGSSFIPGHSGIDGPQVAHLLWQVTRSGRNGQNL